MHCLSMYSLTVITLYTFLSTACMTDAFVWDGAAMAIAKPTTTGRRKFPCGDLSYFPTTKQRYQNKHQILKDNSSISLRFHFDDESDINEEQKEEENDDVLPHLSVDSTSPWMLHEDWALMNRISDFTVQAVNIGNFVSSISDDKYNNEKDHHQYQVRTFWAQLVASTPALSKRSPREAYEHFTCLMEEVQRLSKKTHKIEENSTTHPYLHSSVQRFGPSPPLLDDWTIVESQHYGDHHRRWNGYGHGHNLITGTLKDGNVIWLQYHLMGRLPGDILCSDVTSSSSSSSSSSSFSLTPGGYLESVNGQIYELGEPSRSMLQHWKEEDFTTKGFHGRENTELNLLSALTTSSSLRGFMSAMIASTLLSASIGFGAGIGIIADEAIAPSHSTLHQTTTSTNIPDIIHEKGRISSVQSSHSPYSAPSLEERKAWTKYRILHEERLLENIHQQLQIDQANMKGLERLEQMEKTHYSQKTSTGTLLP